jgi:hypothetical protein
MPDFKIVYEEFKVLGKELVDKVAELIREGNVRRIIVKDEKGNTFIEIPLTVATVGVIAAPVLAALGTIAALIAHFTLGVEKVQEKPPPSSPEPPSSRTRESGGASRVETPAAS